MTDDASSTGDAGRACGVVPRRRAGCTTMGAPLRVALPGQAWDVVADGPEDGPLFVVSYGSNPMETALTSVDREGRVKWQRTFPGTGCPWIRATGRGTVWVSRPEATWRVLDEIGADGRTARSVVPPSRPGEDIGTFALLPDGFCVLWAAARGPLRAAERAAGLPPSCRRHPRMVDADPLR
ncbi:hypothetical protein ABZ901_03580 [Actinacidiphila alni]|uniref:hypothetical protein n=1 Tax=Actinacidiphila alni TaxID=380248 RepID=UPI0033D2F515